MFSFYFISTWGKIDDFSTNRYVIHRPILKSKMFFLCLYKTICFYAGIRSCWREGGNQHGSYISRLFTNVFFTQVKKLNKKKKKKKYKTYFRYELISLQKKKRKKQYIFCNTKNYISFAYFLNKNSKRLFIHISKFIIKNFRKPVYQFTR